MIDSSCSTSETDCLNGVIKFDGTPLGDPALRCYRVSN
jgi:hypothetical protein